MPYFFSWANEPWSRRWNGEDGGTKLIPNKVAQTMLNNDLLEV